jgi:hypothetical protein
MASCFMTLCIFSNTTPRLYGLFVADRETGLWMRNYRLS